MVAEKVRVIVADCLCLDLDEVNIGDRLSDLGADSLDILDIEHRLDNEFKGRLFLRSSDKSDRHWNTIQDVVDFVESEVK